MLQPRLAIRALRKKVAKSRATSVNLLRMKRWVSFGLLVLAAAGSAQRQRVSFDEDWRFHKGDSKGYAFDRVALSEWLLHYSLPFAKDPSKVKESRRDLETPSDYLAPEFDDSDWRKLDLPHDWAIEGTFSRQGGGGTGRLPSAGVGWYRKTFDVAASELGKRFELNVDGAMSYASVWLNGNLVGGWPYGYASWNVNLNPSLKAGRNVLVILVDNPDNASRWYPGGGIYRNVWLTKTSPVHVNTWGTSITTPQVSKDAADISIVTSIANDTAISANLEVTTSLFRADAHGVPSGGAVASMTVSSVVAEAQKLTPLRQTFRIPKPALWGPPPTQKPNRYVAVTTLKQDRKEIDRYSSPFGIRSLQYTPNDGFMINGERVDFQGVCMHHDLGALGSAVNERALHRQVDELIEMGVNAIRTSHNPPAPELLEYCDEKGIMVMDEYSDIWQAPKTPNDYHLMFDNWHEQDLRALIRRDRNHPSVVMWSIGNEVGEQFRAQAGADVGKMLTAIAHDEDPTRLTTTAMNAARADGPFPSIVDLIGLNYQGTGVRSGPALYPVFHAKYPNNFVYGSETTSTISSRGEYFFPVVSGLGVPASATAGEDPARAQLSSYDLYSAPWSYSPDKEFMSLDKWRFVGGEFVWTGWDYLGEPTPFDTSRSSYFGIIDLAGFKKDRFYLYQARWRPDLPMAHILPHWNWPERVGQVTPVHVYSSGDEAELFLNGKSLGRKKRGQYEYRFRWDDVVYQPGTLVVKTFKNGKEWATDTVSTTGDASRFGLTPDRKTLKSDGKDLVFVTVAIQDDKGRTVPRSHPRIEFSVSGPGEIVATDNGDATDFDPFYSTSRQAFNGLALVIVKAKKGASGEVVVTASSNGMRAGTTSISVGK